MSLRGSKISKSFQSSPQSTARKHRIYTDEQKETFFALWCEKPFVPVTKIAREVNIDPRAAQGWVRKLKDGNEWRAQSNPDSGAKERFVLSPKSISEIKRVVRQDPFITLDRLVEYCSSNSIHVNISTLQSFLREEVALVFQITKPSRCWQSPPSLSSNIGKSVSINLLKECFFLDEGILNIYSKGSWNAEADAANVASQSRSVLLAIGYNGYKKITIKAPAVVQSTADAELFTLKKFVAALAKGLTPSSNRKYIVISNFVQADTGSITKVLNSFGFGSIFIPFANGQSNPMERLWLEICANLKTRKILENESLSDRIKDSFTSVSTDLVRQSIDAWVWLQQGRRRAEASYHIDAITEDLRNYKISD